MDNHAKILLFTLRPGQSIAEHSAPSSPFYVVVLQGTGTFTDGNRKAHSVEPNDLLVFDAAERHSVTAGDQDFIFRGILQQESAVRQNHLGGSMAKT